MRISRSINTILDKRLGVVIKKTSSAPTHHGSMGMVEYFESNEVKGWVSADAGDFPLRVTLYINSYPVLNTWANVGSKHNSEKTVREFYLATKGIWKFCKEGDRITIKAGDVTLPIYQKGTYKRVGRSGSSSIRELKRLLSKGYVFNRNGTLQLSKKQDAKWQNQIFSLYQSITEVLESKHGITPFLMYGSLLGQVREGGFIGHDDDFDLAFISTKRTGKSAALELREVALSFIEAGFPVELRKTAIHIHDKENPKLRIDLFHLFFDKEKTLRLPFGIAGVIDFTRDDWQGLKNASFSGHPVTVPKNATKMVELLYGPSWQTPISGFSWPHARTRRDASGDVPEAVREEVNKLSTYSK